MSFQNHSVNIDWNPTLLHFQAAWGKGQGRSSSSLGTSPTKNTFIEYPVLRDPSLEDFLKERGSRSCPNSMNSCLQNLEHQLYPGLVFGGRDLEALAEDAIPDERPRGAPAGPQGPIQRLEDVESGVTTELPVKNTFIEFPIVRNFSLDPFLKERQSQSCPPTFDLNTDRSTVASEEDTEFLPAPAHRRALSQGSAYPMPHAPPPIETAPLAGPSDELCGADNGMLNLGSLEHGNGRCKPCAFRWKDGCKTGLECPFCHLCPPGEVKRRKKDKLAWRKVARAFRSHGMNLNMFGNQASRYPQQYS